MSQKLLNKVAVVTGAGSGIGRAIAERFLHEGAKVVLFSRTRAPLEEIETLAPARVLAVDGDVTVAADLDRLAEAAQRRFGQVDVLIPNAGIARVVPFTDCTPEVIAEQFDVNFMGAVQTVRAFLPVLGTPSTVLFITTCLTRTAFPGLAAYNASKAALSALARTLSKELAPHGIRVNSLAPGPITTSLWNKVGLSGEALQSAAEQICSRLNSGKFGQPEDIAEAALFLASDAARNVHGQEILVDGGYTLG